MSHVKMPYQLNCVKLKVVGFITAYITVTIESEKSLESAVCICIRS